MAAKQGATLDDADSTTVWVGKLTVDVLKGEGVAVCSGLCVGMDTGAGKGGIGYRLKRARGGGGGANERRGGRVRELVVCKVLACGRRGCE